MRFVVFGGSGDMGRRAVFELARTPGVERVTIVGSSEASASRAHALIRQALDAVPPGRGATDEPAARRGSAGKGAGAPTADLAIAAVDAADNEAVVRLMREHDVAVGALGPFYLYEERLVRAAIKARKPYVSICDDADATAAALSLDDQARVAGVPILTGMGWTPGLSNMLALRAFRQMDSVDAIRIAWAGASGPSPGPAVVFHTMHIFSGDITTYAGGRYRRIPAGSEPERVRFPDPLGELPVCHVGHPEPLTLPRHLPGVKLVSLKGGVVEPLLHGLAAWTGRLGLTSTHGRRQFMSKLLRPFIPLLCRIGSRGNWAGLVVRVEGQKGGRPKVIASAALATMDALTSVPLAIGALGLARGEIRRTGVFPPEAEGGPDPEAFLAELAERGVQVMHTVENP